MKMAFEAQRGVKGNPQGISLCCAFCGKKFYVPPSRINTGRYCSNICKYKMMSKRQKGKPSNNYLGGWNKGIKMSPLSKETIEKRIRTIKENKMKNGYKTTQSHRIRISKKFSDWKDFVFKRDDYTCQLCQKRGGIELNAHHIEYFHKYPELRFDVNNGITLCVECHKDIHDLMGWN